ncbi:DNA helicase PcrA [Muricomes sp. OA1]|uniref:ATP-dependent DNA helicase n=2 Tax=Lachnospiraceae TaxID=186803 RepID=A0A3E2WYX4_9FIRM|nr:MULTISPECIES: DNA helicase PcrA [Clostridia]MCH1973307.1 DNA helicase PcrA [Muricomes sp. OA1]MSC84203.1 DNA helicase PcrA [Eubacterium sp. BIOML-A1]MSD06627.1 DNA helicase PcrA [Eubacterium sp. BIOML-A2]RGC33663.1 DNA helicase PcrA [Hungatella hathewayi]RYT18905.1 DNA helicase PcrA [Eubacterium sp. am_0171]
MSIYDTLNEQQREAVYCTDGPLLILAGAGSGKTRVLTHRIAYLIEEKGVNPWNILAITFTNKAAGEMRERVDKLVGFGSESIWVSTFHSTCVRILRRYIDRLGYDNNFTIYDADDQKTLMKDVCKLIDIDTKVYKERSLLGAISSAKDELVTPEEYELNAAGDYGKQKIAKVYREYEKQLRANNALDFDDLLVKTVQLFQTQPDVLENYQERFRYIMVDEYQDTNTVQFKFVSLLAGKYKNLCVVGDDDQSIYKFRGANIKNILNFEQEFQDARVIKLEQNYRSTSNILNAANAVISNNCGRKEKTLWTDNGEGEKIQCRQFDTGYDEAEFIAEDIRKHVREEGSTYNDHAILYRTNAQSRLFEERFVSSNIPYKIVGGVNFYARREIKDLLAYLKTIDNGQDDLAVRRIINVPKRGIGLTTINRVQESALEREIGFYEALLGLDLIPNIGRSAAKLESFVALIEYFKTRARVDSISDLMNEIIEKTGYVENLEAEDKEDAQSCIENIDELLSKIAAYEETCLEQDEKPTLSGFLEEVALVADIDSLDENQDYVVLMTLHSAKGLEFPHVYLAGMEDGLFPSYMTITSDDIDELEEERRLCYVGITRAEKELTVSCARRRMIRGETQFNKMSRFLKEIPQELLETGADFGETYEMPAQNTYQQAKQLFKTKAFAPAKVGKQFTVTKEKSLDYTVGNRVRHMKFGEGLVRDITEGGRDFEVTVDFDTAGTKKMFASFAKLRKI